MARIKKNQLSGKIGNLIYRQTRYGIAVAQAPVKPAQTPSSEKQMRIRTQLANLSANCRLYQQAAFVFPLRADAFFEDKQPQHTLFNLFVQMNSNRCPVYLTRQERSAGGCVVAPCQFSRGTLAPIV